MSDIVKLVTELGSFGLLLGLAGWIIYDYIKNKNTNKNDIKSTLDASLVDIKSSISSISNRVAGLEKTIIDMKSNPTVVVNNSQTTKSEHSKQFMDRLK
jgi:archaellum component FlaC